jgi:rhamnulose-1-phosphate aldolase
MRINHKLKAVIQDVAKVAQWLWMKGWAEQNAGNISVDVTEMIPVRSAGLLMSFKPFVRFDPVLSQRCFLVTVAGSRMRDIIKAPAENLMLIELPGSGKGYTLLWGGNGDKSRPTSEMDSHLAVHALMRHKHKSQKVFIHTHPTHLIALSHIARYAVSEKALNDLLFSTHPEVAIALPEGIGLAPYRCPGTKELSAVTMSALTQHRVILWEKHGCAAVGDNVFQAFDLIDVANKAAAIYLLCRASGNKFQGLTGKQIGDVIKRFI